MADYIEREAAVNALVKIINDYDMPKDWNKGMSAAMSALHRVPAAPVREVVRGKWKPIDLSWGRNYYYCSACEETVDMPTAMGIPMFRFCPNCGAEMEGET